MPETLKSPGAISFESKSPVSNIRGSDLSVAYMLGIAKWGKVAVPTECSSFSDFLNKFGSYMPGYYLAKGAKKFFDEGGRTLHVVRTAHYTAGVLDAIKSSKILQGYNAGEEDRTKVNTLTLTSQSEGTEGDKINVSNQKAATTLNGQLTAAAHTSAILTSVDGFSIGDVVEISDGTYYVRVIITYINTGTKTIYFKSVTLANAIADLADVKTASRHQVRTTLTEDLVTDATSAKVANINGIEVGALLTIVDTQSGSPNSLTVVVTSISQNTISFDSVGTITTIAIANSEVVSQEFNLDVYFGEEKVEEYTYLSMIAENEKNYIENKIKGSYIDVSDLNGTEDHIGDLPEVIHLLALAGGVDGLTGLADTDFIGDETIKNGLRAFDSEPDRFAQIGCPDMRTASFQTALLLYADSRNLWAVLDFDFSKTPDEAKEYVTETALFNSNYGEISYPNVKWKNPLTGVVSDTPQSSAVMGLNARVWGAINKGPHISAAGTEDGKFRSIAGLESDYTQDKTWRDLLYPSRINPLYRHPQAGYIKYGIRTLEINGDFPQIPERVVFLYARHSTINGTPWIIFKNIDTSNLKRIKRTLAKFYRGMRIAGMLKGLTDEEAFVVDVSEQAVNTTERQEKGEIWVKVGLATKKAGEFAYFDFSKKIAT